MKKIILLTALAISFVSIACANFSLQNWKYEKEIQNVKKGLIEVPLDNEVFANAAKGLADVRIVNNVSKEIPYKLISTKSEEGRKDYYPKMINNSVVPGKYSTVILDLGQRGTITNSITIRTSSENFQRNVTVYGSDDQVNWNVLKSNGYIYDYTDRRGNIKSQNTTILFSDSTFAFLKIEVSDTDNVPVVINSVTVSQYIQKNAEQFNMTPQFEATQDKDRKMTILVSDLGQSGIPINKISLTASGKNFNFNRGVAIYSSNDKNSSDWKSVGQGYIFRYNTSKFIGENTAVNITETTDRYLKIMVFNNDDAALGFSQIIAFATYRELIFQAQDEAPYRLYYGNSKVQSPQYDMEKYFQYLDLANAQKVTLGLQNINSQFVPEKEPEKPFSERMPYFLPVSLCTLGLILLFLVYKFLKKSA